VKLPGGGRSKRGGNLLGGDARGIFEKCEHVSIEEANVHFGGRAAGRGLTFFLDGSSLIGKGKVQHLQDRGGEGAGGSSVLMPLGQYNRKKNRGGVVQENAMDMGGSVVHDEV